MRSKRAQTIAVALFFSVLAWACEFAVGPVPKALCKLGAVLRLTYQHGGVPP